MKDRAVRWIRRSSRRPRTRVANVSRLSLEHPADQVWRNDASGEGGNVKRIEPAGKGQMARRSA
jgi:hypothetical protein